MMNGMNMAGMGWGMTAITVLVVIVLLLAVAALVKYLFSGGRR